MKKKNIGSSFDSWLREEGIHQEVTATAIKRVLARQVEAAMKEKNFSKAEMARRMHTSRAALGRLLDPETTRLPWPPCKRPPSWSDARSGWNWSEPYAAFGIATDFDCSPAFASA